MEENIQDDKLDDYVRKSFDDHEEMPSTDMWDRIEGDLYPPVQPARPGLFFRRYGWQALAAAVILILFSTLVCEHLYYEKKIQDLTVAIHPGQDVLTKSPDDSTTTKALQSERSQVPTTPQPSTKGTSPAKRPLTVNPPAQSGSTDKTSAPKSSQNQLPRLSKEAIDQPKAVPIASTSFEETKDKSQVVIPSEGANEAPGGRSSEESHALGPVVPTPLAIDYLVVDRTPQQARSIITPAMLPASIKPVKQPGDWYVGIQSSLLTVIEKSRTPANRPGRPAFVNKQESQDIATIWWFKTGKKVNRHIIFESGIGYQSTTRTATHTPRFRFGDGSHWGAPLAGRRSFTYDLSTYGGSAEVSLRMEQTSGTPAQDDEPVALEITTTERQEWLRVPLLAGYRFGQGRWQGQVKAGLLGNVALKNDLSVSASVSQNARFQPIAGSEGLVLRLSPKRFFMGYSLSAGTEFYVGRQWSLVAESALIGDFRRNDPYKRRLPQRYLAGLNLGANYYF